MSYESQAQLEADPDFAARSRACVLKESETFKDDGRPDIAACAQVCLKDYAGTVSAFLRYSAGGPGIAEKVDTGNGKIDQSLVTDGDLLALTQAAFPAIAALYFNPDGTPKP